MADASQAPHQTDRSSRPTLPFEGFGPEVFELHTHVEELVPEPVPTGRRAAVREWGLRQWPRLAWLGLAAILSFGSAGVVAAMSPPAPESRQELTYGADRELRARLDDAAVDLALLNQQVNGLGDQARRLLGSLSRIDREGLESAYSSGDAALAEIDRLSGKLDDEMDCAFWTPERAQELERTYDGALVAGWQKLCRSLDSVEPLRSSWTTMEDGSSVAMGVADAIAEHDRIAEEALQQATQGRYPEALARLAEADDALADARQLGAALDQAGRDVSTLNQWLERIDAMDAALETLWREMIASQGRITVQVTAALKAVSEAQSLLPASDAILSVVVYELAGYLLNEGISIEQAKGQIGGALAALAESPAT
jgi:hypothetical protein